MVSRPPRPVQPTGCRGCGAHQITDRFLRLCGKCAGYEQLRRVIASFLASAAP
jgi:hypothetical protein